MMNRVEMNENMMEEVNGGWICKDEYEQECARNRIHPHCGGEIEGVYNPFSSCKCKKCGETHYWYEDFFPTATSDQICY